MWHIRIKHFTSWCCVAVASMMITDDDKSFWAWLTTVRTYLLHEPTPQIQDKTLTFLIVEYPSLNCSKFRAQLFACNTYFSNFLYNIINNNSTIIKLITSGWRGCLEIMNQLIYVIPPWVLSNGIICFLFEMRCSFVFCIYISNFKTTPKLIGITLWYWLNLRNSWALNTFYKKKVTVRNKQRRPRKKYGFDTAPT